MTVVILTAVPPGLRGHLTRWLLELTPGVFIGHISARVRDLIWQRTIEYLSDGRALMVYTARNEQRLVFAVHGHDWTPADYDGISLMRRGAVPAYVPAELPVTQQATHMPSDNQAREVRPETGRKRRKRRTTEPKR